MFFPDRSLSREILFPSTNFLSAQSPFEDGIREVSSLPRFVPNKPCVERASACQARACTGAEGFIHSEESVCNGGVESNGALSCSSISGNEIGGYNLIDLQVNALKSFRPTRMVMLSLARARPRSLARSLSRARALSHTLSLSRSLSLC